MRTVLEDLGRYVAGGTTTVLRVALVLATLLFVAHATLSIAFPYPLDYGEAPLIDQAVRLLHGDPLYRPDLAQPPYTVTNYPPVFVLVLAPLIALVGPAFAIGRAVSILSSLAAATLLGMTVYEGTRHRRAGWVTGLLFLAVPYVVRWSPLVRVDLFALALSTGALYTAVRRGSSRSSLTVCACLLTAAVYTRQSYGLAAPLAAFVWTWRTGGRAKALRLAALVTGLGLGLFALLNLLTKGGFYLHVVRANANAFEITTLLTRAGGLARSMPVFLALAIAYIVFGIPKAPLAFLIAPYLVGAIGSAATIGKVGSNVNYLLELVAALSLASGTLLAWLHRGLELPPQGHPGRQPTWRLWLSAALQLALALQVGILCGETLDREVEDLKWRLKSRRQIDRLALTVRSTPDTSPVLADEYMGLLTMQGRRLYLQPFETTQLSHDGHWNQAPLLRQIERHSFPLILIHHFPHEPVYLSRWTPEALELVFTRYIATDYAADTVVFQPREEDEVYPAPDTACPDAAWALPTTADFGAWWFSRELWFMGEGPGGTIPVYAVADGLLTRRPGWHDAVAVQHPDPHDPDAKVWTFYGDMAASPETRTFITGSYSPGTEAAPVQAGTLLGYQGQVAQLGSGLWPHVRFAIVPALPDGSFPAALVGYGGTDDAPVPHDFAEAGLRNPSEYLGTVRSQVMGKLEWLPLRCSP